jgi:putative hemolysin
MLGLLVLIVLIAIVGLITLYEMAVFSARPEHMRLASEQGDRRGTVVMSFIRRPSRILGGLQILATLTTILLGSLTQIWFSTPLEARLQEIFEDSVAANLTFWINVVGITVFTLIFANMLPKRIAYSLADEISIRGAFVAKTFGVLMAPFAISLGAITDGIVRVLGLKLPTLPEVQEADIEILLRHGLRTGKIDRHERDIVLNAFRLSDLLVRDIMTPRQDIQTVRSTLSGEELREAVDSIGRSQVIVVAGNLDDFLGVVWAKDLLTTPVPDLQSILHQPAIVPPSASVLRLMELFRSGKARLALVVGDNARVLGLVTFNDVVGALLGELKTLQEL